MDNFIKFKKYLYENQKSNKTMELKKDLESSNFGYTKKAGNGIVKKKGKNLVIYNSFFYDEKKAIKSLENDWSAGGSYYDYFKEEYGVEIKVVKSGADFNSNVFGKNTGAVWVEIEVK